MTKKAYREPSSVENVDGEYYRPLQTLIGPGGFECTLGEPEDCMWCRDGKEAKDRLNEQHELLVRAHKVLVNAIHRRDLASEADAICLAIEQLTAPSE